MKHTAALNGHTWLILNEDGTPVGCVYGEDSGGLARQLALAPEMAEALRAIIRVEDSVNDSPSWLSEHDEALDAVRALLDKLDA